MNPPKRRRLRRLIWLLTGVAVAGLALMMGGILLVRYQGQRDLAQAIAETDRLDPRWRLENIEADRGPVLAQELNGFEQVEAILSDTSTAKPPIPTQVQDARDRFGIGLLSKDQAKLLRPAIDRAKTKLDLARGLTAFAPGRGDSIIPRPDKMDVFTRPYMGFLDLAKGLCADARLRIFDGDISGAAQDCFTVLHIGGTLANEPSLMGQMVRAAIDVRTCDLIEQLLSSGKCPASQLANLQSNLEAELVAPRVLLAVRGQRAIFDWMLEQIQMGGILKEKYEAGFIGPPMQGQSIISRIKQYLLYSLVMSNLPGHRAMRMRAANELVAIGRLPYSERLQALKAYIEKGSSQSGNRFGWLDVFPDVETSWAKYLQQELSVDAVLSCTIVAIATERFRQDHNYWPKSLDELTPLYLKTLPPDPFTGEPLHFVRKGPALVIYSVGENLKDDGGMLANRFATGGMDVGFVLLDPDQLRRAETTIAYLERVHTSLNRSAQKFYSLLP